MRIIKAHISLRIRTIWSAPLFLVDKINISLLRSVTKPRKRWFTCVDIPKIITKRTFLAPFSTLIDMWMLIPKTYESLNVSTWKISFSHTRGVIWKVTYNKSLSWHSCYFPWRGCLRFQYMTACVKPLIRQSQQKSSAFLVCWNV